MLDDGAVDDVFPLGLGGAWGSGFFDQGREDGVDYLGVPGLSRGVNVAFVRRESGGACLFEPMLVGSGAWWRVD